MTIFDQYHKVKGLG